MARLSRLKGSSISFREYLTDDPKPAIMVIAIKRKVEMETQYTTVQISIETRDRLMALGKKGETYEEIIRKLLDALEEG